jgi:hypothetical protein
MPKRSVVLGHFLRFLAVLGLMAASVAGPAARAHASPPEGSIPDLAALGFRPVFDEDFDGTTLDESVWKIVQHDYAGVRTRESVSVAGGNLRLTTWTDAQGRPRTGHVQTGEGGTVAPSEAGFDAAFGYVEARINLPDGPDTSSALWTMSANGNNSAPFGDVAADGPELDIMEHGNTQSTTGTCAWPGHLQVPCSEFILSGGHWDGFDEDHKVLHTTGVKKPTPGTSLQGNFHTYGMLWTPDGYRYFIDGEETYRVTAGVSYIPQYLILSTYASNPATNYGPLGSASNDVTLVDYVRVWQRPISEIPDQHLVSGRPLSVPFTVTDFNYSSAARSEPGTVRVTGSSSNQSVVPDGNIVVTGNGPADPDGSLTNGDFEAGSPGWTFPTLSPKINNATVWSTSSYSNPNSLHISEVNNDATRVGRVEQTIAGLRPDTTYILGFRYDVEIGFTDTNGNGRPDPGEPFTEPGETETDGTASFNAGIVDADANRPGAQPVALTLGRNGWTEANNPDWWRPQPWPEEQVKFTTGPNTTQVTFFVSNEAFAGTQDDSDVSVDSIWVRPLVPAQRTVAVVPATDTTGSAQITLTARDAANTVLGTETFTVSFQRGSSFAGGDFESDPVAAGWSLFDGDPKNGRGADVVVDNPWSLNRVLRLAAPAGTPAEGSPQPAATIGTAIQPVTGLTPGVPYTLSARGKGGLAVVVADYGGSQLTAPITTADWSTATITFTPTGQTATILVLDWDGTNGSSFVDDMLLLPGGSVGAVPMTWPALTSLGEQAIPSSTSAVLPFSSTATAITATSDNPEVLPNPNVAVVGSGTNRVLALQPVHDRTGKAVITVSYTDGSGTHPKAVPVVVSDNRFRNPAFERRDIGWGLPATASVTSTGPRSGVGALQLNATAAVPDPVVQTIGIPATTRTECITAFTVGGWAKGTARLTVRQPRATPVTLATLTWPGSGAWTEQRAPFTSPGCFDDTKAFDIVLEDTATGDATAAQFDDLYLVHAPAVRTIRDLSIHQGQTAFAWNTRRDVYVGRVPASAFWDPGAVSVTSSDQSVLPDANVERRLTDSGWPYLWHVGARAGAKTERSTVTVRLTDPFTGANAKSFTVTINAGNNFTNGDFERDLTGWGHGWVNDSFDRREMRRETLPNPPPTDADGVLRISSGIAGYKITGLTAGQSYTVRANARGSGSSLRAVANTVDSPWSWGQQRGSVTINSSTWAAAPDLTFTALPDDPSTPNRNETDTWIAVWDDDTGASPVAASSEPCATYTAGETCVDDLGLFRTGDIS